MLHYSTHQNSFLLPNFETTEMSTNSIASSDHQRQSRRRSHQSRTPKSLEFTSRYLSPTANKTSSPNTSVSPVRQKSLFDRNVRISFDDPATKSLWPSSAAAAAAVASSTGSKKLETLAEHLGNLRLEELLSDKRNGHLNPKHESERNLLLLNHQKSSSEISRFEIPCSSSSGKSTEDKPVLGKLKLKNKPYSSASSGILPGRFSVDENALSNSKSEYIGSPLALLEGDQFNKRFASNDSESSAAGVRKTASFSSYMSPTIATNRRKHNSTISSHRIEDSPKKMHDSIMKTSMRRANSLNGYGTVTSERALSSGRTSSSKISVENKGKLLKTYSNLKPTTSPQKSAKGIEKLLNVMGINLFKTKQSSTNSQTLSASSSNIEGALQLRLLHCRLMQWRFVNAKARNSFQNVTTQAEMNLIFTQDSVVRLQRSVTQKRLKYRKESLLWKLNVILHSQMKLLETWGEIERQHTFAVSVTKDSLLAVLCKVPLKDGAVFDTQVASHTLRRASELTAIMNSMLTVFSTQAEETSTLLSELAEVVANENFLIDECLEMCRMISVRQFQECSLRSNLIQKV